MKKSALVFFYGCLSVDARVRRQLEFLKKIGFEKIALAYIPYIKTEKTPEINNIEIIRIEAQPRDLIKKAEKAFNILFRNFRNLEWFYFGSENIVELILKKIDFEPSIILVNDFYPVPFGFAAKERFRNRPKLIIDAHEIYIGEAYAWRFKLFRRPYMSFIEKEYLKMADGFITVSNGIADYYKKFINVEPLVMFNAPSYKEIEPGQPEKHTINLVHHGGAQKLRRIEELIRLVGLLDERYKLTLYLVPSDKGYIDFLKEKAKELPEGKIIFKDPVKPEEVSETLNSYDIGIFLLERKNLINLLYAAPNKFFEFIQARLMCFFTPFSEEVNKIIEEYDLGIVTKTYDIKEAADILNSLSPEEIMKYKENADKAARIFNADRMFEDFARYLDDVLAGKTLL